MHLFSLILTCVVCEFPHISSSSIAKWEHWQGKKTTRSPCRASKIVVHVSIELHGYIIDVIAEGGSFAVLKLFFLYIPDPKHNHQLDRPRGLFVNQQIIQARMILGLTLFLLVGGFHPNPLENDVVATSAVDVIMPIIILKCREHMELPSYHLWTLNYVWI